MKIISAKQSRVLDQETMNREPISSIDLMERAGGMIYHEIYAQFGRDKIYIILCGNGNNGGDGLVIARRLSESNLKVFVFIDEKATQRSPENIENLKKLENLDIEVLDFSELNRIKNKFKNSVIIDALFGVGINRPLENPWAKIIAEVNELEGEKIAIDLPSGLIADKIDVNPDLIFKADITYTIGQPKLTFLLPETSDFVGEVKTIDIQLNQDYLNELESNYFYINKSLIKSIYKHRLKFSHKGNYGHAFVIAGSYGKMGASVLATKTALKSGAGLVTSYIPKCGYDIMQISVPEAMCLTDEREEFITEFPNIDNYKSIAVGPGLGTEKATENSFFQWLNNTNFEDKSLVLDADALNLLSKDKFQLNNLPGNTILTPHPKEFERLAGASSNSLERLELAQQFANKYQIILVLKDAVTAIFSPDGNVYFNSTGNAGLATGGSGDSLTGIITGLLAQGYSPLEASQLGVWLHGKSADIALKDESMETFTASQIAEYLGKAFISINSPEIES